MRRRSFHLTFLIDDTDALLSRVERGGWWRLREPQTVQGGDRDGFRLVYVRAPDGLILLEFLQRSQQVDGHAAKWEAVVQTG
jgi:hypothetical protein